MQASESISAAISLAFKALICASDASLQARLEIGSLENFTRWLRYGTHLLVQFFLENIVSFV